MVQFVRNCDIPEPPECVVTVPPFKPITPNISDIPHEFPTALVTKLLPCNKKDRFPCPDIIIDNEDCLNAKKIYPTFLSFQEGDSKLTVPQDDSTVSINADWEGVFTINLDVEAICCDNEKEDHDEVVVSPIIDIELPELKIPCATMRFEPTVITESEDATASLDFTVDITPETCSELVVTPSLKFPKPCVTTVIARVYLLSVTAYEEVLNRRSSNVDIDPGKLTWDEFMEVRALPFDSNNVIKPSYNDFAWFACICDLGPTDYNHDRKNDTFIEKILYFDPLQNRIPYPFYVLPLDTLKNLASADGDEDVDNSNNRIEYPTSRTLLRDQYWTEGDFVAVRLDICIPDIVEIETVPDRYQPVIGEIQSSCPGQNENYSTVTMEVTRPRRFAGVWEVYGNYIDPMYGFSVPGILDLKTRKIYANITESEDEVTTFKGVLAGLTLAYKTGVVISYTQTDGPNFIFTTPIQTTLSNIGVNLPPGTPVTVEVHHKRCSGAGVIVLKDYSLPMLQATLTETVAAGATGTATISPWFNGSSTLEVVNWSNECRMAGAKGLAVFTDTVWSFFPSSSSEDDEGPCDCDHIEYNSLGICNNKIFDVTPGKTIYVTALNGYKYCDVTEDVRGNALTDDEKSLLIVSNKYSSKLDVAEQGEAVLTQVTARVLEDGKVFIEHDLSGGTYDYDVTHISAGHYWLDYLVLDPDSFTSFDSGDGLVTSSYTAKQYEITDGNSTSILDVPFYTYNDHPVFDATPGDVNAHCVFFGSTGYLLGKLGDPCEDHAVTVTKHHATTDDVDWCVKTWHGTGVDLRFNPLFNTYEGAVSGCYRERTNRVDRFVPTYCCDSTSSSNYSQYGYYDIDELPEDPEENSTFTWEPTVNAQDITVNIGQSNYYSTLKRVRKSIRFANWHILPTDLSCCILCCYNSYGHSNRPFFVWEYTPGQNGDILSANWTFEDNVALYSDFNAKPLDFLIGSRKEMLKDCEFKKINNEWVFVEKDAYGMDGNIKKPGYHWKPSAQEALTTEYTFTYHKPEDRKDNDVIKFTLMDATSYPIVYDNRLREYVIRYTDSKDDYYIYDRSANTGNEIDHTYTWTCEAEPFANKTITFTQFMASGFSLSKSNNAFRLDADYSARHYWVADANTTQLLNTPLVFEAKSCLEPIELTYSTIRETNTAITGFAWILEI